MEIEQQQQIVPPPVAQPQQQTLTGRFCRCLFTTIFYMQLVLISSLVIFLTLRGLVFTKSPNFYPKKWYTPLLSSVALSGLLSIAWNCFFIYNIRATVKATFWFAPLLTTSVGILLFVYSTWVARVIGVLLIFFSISQTCYSCVCIVPKMHKFTFKMLPIATGSQPLRAGTRAIAVFSVILSVFYSGFLVAGIGGATATKTGLDILFISIIVISLAWTMQVVKNVQEVAISKARYVYFARDEEMNAYEALRAIVANQLGSVCIGSTLVPLFVLLRGWNRNCNNKLEHTIYESHQGCNWIANHLILYGNRYGFVHVGVYGKGFAQASSDTWKKIRTVAGLEQLIDSDITSSICFLSAIAVGGFSALTAGVWALLSHKDYLFELTLYALIIGYFVARVSSAWLQACVMGYYVAYSEDPRSSNFDKTIPDRINRQNIENLTNEEYYNVRQEEDEEITYA